MAGSAMRSFAVAAAARQLESQRGLGQDIAGVSDENDADSELHDRRDMREGDERRDDHDDRDDRSHATARSARARRTRHGGRRRSHSAGSRSSRSRTGARAAEDEEFTTLQTRRLAALSDAVFKPQYLRRFFRMLDSDHSHEVSAAEIQRGLLALGFHQCGDPTVLSRLLYDIDDDRTGTITESEFLSFFSKTTRAALNRKLDGYAKDYVLVRVTVFGRGLVAESFTVAHTALETVLDVLLSRLGPTDHLWLDVVGYSPAVYAILAARFGLDLEVLTDALVFQSPKLDLSAGVSHDSDDAVRALIVMHAMKMIRSPIEPDVSAMQWALHLAATRSAYALAHLSCGARVPCGGRARAKSSAGAKAASGPQDGDGAVAPVPGPGKRRISAAIEDAVAAANVTGATGHVLNHMRTRSSSEDATGLPFLDRNVDLSALDEAFMDAHVGVGGEGLRLVSKSRIRDSPPDIAMEQVAIVVVDDRVVITVRGQSSDVDASDDRASTTGSASVTLSAGSGGVKVDVTAPPRPQLVPADSTAKMPSRASLMGGGATPAPLLRSASDGAIPINASSMLAARGGHVPHLRPSASLRAGFPLALAAAGAGGGGDDDTLSPLGGSPRKRGPSVYAAPSIAVKSLSSASPTLRPTSQSPMASPTSGSASPSKAKAMFGSHLGMGVSSRAGVIAAAVREASSRALLPRDVPPTPSPLASPPTSSATASARVHPLPPPPAVPAMTASEAEEEQDALRADAGEVGVMFDTLRGRLLASSDDVTHLMNGSAKALAVEILDAILQHDFSIRDSLKDWEESIAADIRRFPAAHHTQHLYALDRLGKLYYQALQPLCEALDPANWEGEDGEALADARVGHRTTSVEKQMTPPAPEAAAATQRAPGVPLVHRPSFRDIADAVRRSQVSLAGSAAHSTHATARGSVHPHRSSQSPPHGVHTPDGSPMRRGMGGASGAATARDSIDTRSRASSNLQSIVAGARVSGMLRGAPGAAHPFALLEKQASDGAIAAAGIASVSPPNDVSTPTASSLSPSQLPPRPQRGAGAVKRDVPPPLTATVTSNVDSSAAPTSSTLSESPPRLRMPQPVVTSPGDTSANVPTSPSAPLSPSSGRSAPPPPPRSSMKPTPRAPPRPSSKSSLLSPRDGAASDRSVASTPGDPAITPSASSSAAVSVTGWVSTPGSATTDLSPIDNRAVRLPPLEARPAQLDEFTLADILTPTQPSGSAVDASSTARAGAPLPMSSRAQALLSALSSRSSSHSEAEDAYGEPDAQLPGPRSSLSPKSKAAVVTRGARSDSVKRSPLASSSGSIDVATHIRSSSDPDDVPKVAAASSLSPMVRSDSAPTIQPAPVISEGVPFDQAFRPTLAAGQGLLPLPQMGGGAHMPRGSIHLQRGRSASNLTGVSGRPSFNLVVAAAVSAAGNSTTTTTGALTARGNAAVPSLLMNSATGTVPQGRPSLRAGAFTGRNSIVAGSMLPVTARARPVSRASAGLAQMTAMGITSERTLALAHEVVAAAGKPFIPPTAGRFFRRHIAEFVELADDLEAMCSDLAKQKAAVTALHEQLSSMQSAQMNRTLYVLTLITACSVPVTFLAAYWGMHFEDMREYFPEEVAFGGVKLFWTVMSCVLGTVMFIFWRAGFFAMLR